MSKSPIGVFDSGIGGLTVLKELLARLPNESFVYFGDTARVPYGTKSAETVVRFSRENVRLLLERGVKMVVVACNTASAEALPTLQEEFDVPVVGVIEPGVRAAVKATQTGKIGVIGTAGTIGSGAYHDGIVALNAGAQVISKPCPLFVPLAEEGWVAGRVAELVAHEYLDAYEQTGIDTLVLGCTHYPLLKEVIGRVMGAGVTLVDSAFETSSEVADVLSGSELAAGSGGGEFSVVLSDTSPAFHEVGARFLGREIADIEVQRV